MRIAVDIIGSNIAEIAAFTEGYIGAVACSSHQEMSDPFGAIHGFAIRKIEGHIECFLLLQRLFHLKEKLLSLLFAEIEPANRRFGAYAVVSELLQWFQLQGIFGLLLLQVCDKNACAFTQHDTGMTEFGFLRIGFTENGTHESVAVA